MLLRVIIKNFLSFYEETEFNLFPNPKRESFQSHINTTEKIPLLKQSIIYGANGSGKSNFIKALWFIRALVTEENFLQHIDIQDYKFQLISINTSPIFFEIEFFCRKKYYIYQIELNKVITERLFISGLGEVENELVFERIGNTLQSPHLATNNKGLSEQLLKNNNKSSIIPLNEKFPIIVGADIKSITDWFKTKLKVISISSKVPALIELMSKNSQLFNYANNMLRHLKIADSLMIQDTPLDEWMHDKKNAESIQTLMDSMNNVTPSTSIAAFSDNRNSFSISLKQGEKVVSEFLFDQLGYNNYHKKMKISSQSDGTVRLLTLLPAIYSAAMKGETVFIDEIENSMHPNLIYTLIKFYADNPSKGQLIFTTHLTKFQNQQDLVRPDELWSVEKEHGNSKMRSFNDFKIHHTINIENGYLDGRYGGIPTISDIDNNE